MITSSSITGVITPSGGLKGGVAVKGPAPLGGTRTAGRPLSLQRGKKTAPLAPSDGTVGGGGGGWGNTGAWGVKCCHKQHGVTLVRICESI